MNNIYQNRRVILTDCDGVLLNWNKEFEKFMGEKNLPRLPNSDHDYTIHGRHNIEPSLAHNMVKEFNESNRILNLEPFADSVEYVSKLAALGFKFIVVTSLSNHPDSKIYRTENLHKHFGHIFKEIICLEMGSYKENTLRIWENSKYFWIEDLPYQAEAGLKAGLSPILIDHPYNKHYHTDKFPKVNVKHPWKDIFNIVLNTYY